MSSPSSQPRRSDCRYGSVGCRSSEDGLVGPRCATAWLLHDGGDSDEVIFVCVPAADVVLHDNWQVSGLCATGSVDFELNDVFVPDHFAHPFQPESKHAGTLYRLPTRSIFVWTVAMAERELVQSQLGQVEARVSASRAYLRQSMSELLDAVEADSNLEGPRANLRLACTYAGQSAMWAIGLLTEMAGAISISRLCPLERYERDARAAAKHIAMSPTAYINGGKRLLGHDLSTIPF